MTKWIWRIIIIVPAVDQELANQFAAQIDPDTGGAYTFDQGASVDGQEPATHYFTSTPSTELMRQQMEAGLYASESEGFSTPPMYWQIDALTGELVATNAEVEVTGQQYGLDDALAYAGLMQILLEIPETGEI